MSQRQQNRYPRVILVQAKLVDTRIQFDLLLSYFWSLFPTHYPFFRLVTHDASHLKKN